MPMLGVSKVDDPRELKVLLEEALTLLSKYAKELNEKDSGTRKEYKSIEEWNRDARS